MSNSAKIMLILTILLVLSGAGLWWFISIQEEIANIENTNTIQYKNPVQDNDSQNDDNKTTNIDNNNDLPGSAPEADGNLANIDQDLNQIDAEIAEADDNISQIQP